MKKLIIMVAIVLLTPRLTQAQGTITYMSNIGQPSIGSLVVGSDSWLAESFETGTNASGYFLNSVQLAMTNASGNPSGFTVMLYSAIRAGEFSPGSSLDTLNGSANPLTSGIYTYADASNFMLSPSTAYFIVLTSGTTVANGAYKWSISGVSYNPSGGWHAPLGVAAIDNYQSSDGSHWNGNAFLYPQFAITATPVPEPSPSLLLLLGSVLFIYVRRAFHP